MFCLYFYTEQIVYYWSYRGLKNAECLETRNAAVHLVLGNKSKLFHKQYIFPDSWDFADQYSYAETNEKTNYPQAEYLKWF